MVAVWAGSLVRPLGLIVAAAAAACDAPGPGPADAADADADEAGRDGAEADLEGAVDGEADAGPPVAGSLTLVASEVELLVDRICDLDGDGVGDNAIADLGEPASALFATALGAAVAVAEANSKLGLHFPSIDDLRGPSDPDTVIIPLEARDTDLPYDPSDDLSGEEPFYVEASALDPCGEPLGVMVGAPIEAGEISNVVADRFVVLASVIAVRAARLVGSIEPFGVAADVRVCGHVLAREAGAVHGIGQTHDRPEEALTALEQLLAGGDAFGIPTFQGLTPDVDLDDDGLERFLLDADLHLSRCVDADGRVVEGRDCWQDPGMADGFGLAIGVDLVRGVLVGRAPGWEYDVPLACDGGMPEESLFDFGEPAAGCVGLDEVCDPRSEAPCCEPSNRCAGANGYDYRCLAPCEPALCVYGDLAGKCLGGICRPLGQHPQTSQCEVVGSLCVTEYGASEGTACTEISGSHYCFETCAQEAGPCTAEEHVCNPLVHQDGGVCAFLPPGI